MTNINEGVAGKLQQESSWRLNGESFGDHQLASIWYRFFAYLIDVLIAGALYFLILQPLLYLLGADIYTTERLSLHVILGSLTTYVYFVLLTRYFGQSLGKMVFGLRVIRKDGQAIDWQTAIFREGIGKFISKLFSLHLGFIWAIFYPRKQTWHDIIADTYVVYEPDVTKREKIVIKGQELVSE